MTQPESPEWVRERWKGIVGILEHRQGLTDIKHEHMSVDGLLRHEFEISTAAHIEHGKPLGYNRLILKHPDTCLCEDRP